MTALYLLSAVRPNCDETDRLLDDTIEEAVDGRALELTLWRFTIDGYSGKNRAAFDASVLGEYSFDWTEWTVHLIRRKG